MFLVSELFKEVNWVFYENIFVFNYDNFSSLNYLLIILIFFNKFGGFSIDNKFDFIMKKLELLDSIVEVIKRFDGWVF